MMLLDSNIIIYSTQPEYGDVRQLIAEKIPFVSAISYVEVLGYHKISELDRRDLEDFFALMPLLPISSSILDEAVRLRQQKKMSLGDSLIAATALVHQLTLVTHNRKDFEWITELAIVDPIAEVIH